MTWAQVHDLYDIHDDRGEGHNLSARQNIAPTQDVMFACEPGGKERTTKVGRWWMVPPWAKELSSKYPAFNAKAETVQEKPTFRAAFKSRRCLIPANGYFEWTTGADGQKAPWFIHMPDSCFSFAGLWEYNSMLDLASCTIITMPAEGEIEALHKRMPAILITDVWDDWLSKSTSPESAFDLLGDNHGADMIAYRVGRQVNSSRYSGDDCIEPIEANGNAIDWLGELPKASWASKRYGINPT